VALFCRIDRDFKGSIEKWAKQAEFHYFMTRHHGGTGGERFYRKRKIMMNREGGKVGITVKVI